MKKIISLTFILFVLLTLLAPTLWAADRAVSVSGPTDLYNGQTYQVTVSYQADAQRNVSVYLFNTNSWVVYGSATTTVSAGTGSVTLNVSVSNAPEGTNYQWTGKVEETSGAQLDQVSQWCQVLFSPSPGHITISANFNSPTGKPVNKRAFGLNIFQGFNPNIAGYPGNASYKDKMNAIQSPHLRYHSWEMISSGPNSWVDSNGDWDANRIFNALEGAFSYGPEILINIPWAPHVKGWLNADETLKTQHYADFANWCAELVQIVNIQHGRNVKYWELTNERDDIYYNNCSELGEIFNQAAAAVKAVDPNLLVGGPSFARPFAEHIHNVRDFMNTTKNTIDFISYHSYHLTGTKTNQEIFNAAGWGWVTSGMKGEWNNISSRQIEFHHNEYNFNADYTHVEARINEVSMVFDAIMIVSMLNAGVDVANAWNESDGWFGKLSGPTDFTRRPASYMFENLSKNMLEGDIISSSVSENGKIVQLVSISNTTAQVLAINRSEASQTVLFNFDGLAGVTSGTPVSISESVKNGGLVNKTSTYNELTNGVGYTSEAFAVTLFTFQTDGTNAGLPDGKVIYEYWEGISGTSVALIPLDTQPNGSSELNSIEAPINWNDNFGARIKGYIVPPATGDYTFYIASDDNGQFWLSSNNDESNLTQIASHTGWTHSREWQKYASQVSAPVSLVAGQYYYFEARYKEAGGGDNCAVAWVGPGFSEITVIGADYISSVYQDAPVYNDNAISVSANNTIEAGKSYDVTVEYEAGNNRQIAVYLFNTTNWQNFGYAATNVNPGSGSITLSVEVGNPQPGTDYQWTAKVEERGSGEQLDQVSQWCQVVASAIVAPSNLTATATSSSQVNLVWSDNSSNEDGFKIERKTGATGAWSEIATVGANVQAFSNTDLSASTTYYYRVRAYNNYGNSDFTPEVSATTQEAIIIIQSNIISSTAGAQQSGNPKENAYDGIASSRWANDGTVAKAWIEFILDDTYSLDRVEILFFNGNSRTYPLNIELNGNSIWSGNTTTTSGYWTQSLNGTGNTLRINMTANNSNGSGWLSIYEIRVFGSVQVDEPIPSPGDEYYFYSESGNDFESEGGTISSYAMTISYQTGSAPEGSEFISIAPNNHYASYTFSLPTSNKSDWAGKNIEFNARINGAFDIIMEQGNGVNKSLNILNYASSSAEWQNVVIPVNDFNIDLSQFAKLSFYRLWNGNVSLDFDNLRITNNQLKDLQIPTSITNAPAKPIVVIYPNPVQSDLFIQIKNDGIVGVIHIQDITGRIIQTIEPSGKDVMMINVQNLPHGTYFVSVSINQQKHFYKLIKNYFFLKTHT